MTKSQTDSAAEILEVYRQFFRNFRKHNLSVSDSFLEMILPETRAALSKRARTMKSKLVPTMKVLVYGGRYFSNYASLSSELDQLDPQPDLIIQGGATGSNRLARRWAEHTGIAFHEEPAFWHIHGKQAGPLRNAEMLKLCPDICVAFPGGRGTTDMVLRCLGAGIPVLGPGR